MALSTRKFSAVWTFGAAVLMVLVGLAAGESRLAAQSGRAGLPPTLPGKGLSQHDFLYAGESHDRRIFIVRGGKIVWSYDDPGGKGEISDAVMLSSGNILFCHQFGVTEITPDKKVVWNYDAPAGHEVHTAVPIGKDRVLYIQNGGPALVRVVNIVTGATEKEFALPTKLPVSVHAQFRHARLTERGTLLVAHMDLDKVVEYDSDGKELWSFPAPGAWGVNPLANGNVLIVDRMGVREVTRRGDSVWSFAPSDAPRYKFAQIQQAWRLHNGDTVVNNWVNEWNAGSATADPGSLQALEVTPNKEIVWALSSWEAPAALGPATTFQFLDEGGGAPEDVHFGDIR
ncbi:MAG TPA: PQQ-binding-like beta-propeller repeat protein [Acidisarcina sp.]